MVSIVCFYDGVSIYRPEETDHARRFAIVRRVIYVSNMQAKARQKYENEERHYRKRTGKRTYQKRGVSSVTLLSPICTTVSATATSPEEEEEEGAGAGRAEGGGGEREVEVVLALAEEVSAAELKHRLLGRFGRAATRRGAVGSSMCLS